MGANYPTKDGFSLLEIIVVLAGITLLTAIASTSLQQINSDLDIDEITSDLNNAASECLRAMRTLPPPERGESTVSYRERIKKELALNNDRNNVNNSLNTRYPFLIDTIDEKKIKEIGYEFDERHTSCVYLQINPIDTSSDSLPKLGFGILNNKVTKYGISKEEDKDSHNACERWAGSLCVDSTNKSFDKFFNHMWTVRFRREVCELNFQNSAKATIDITKLKRWEPGDAEEGDLACQNSQPEGNDSSIYKQKCTISRCNKDAYARGGAFIGYSESDLDQARSIACSEAIKEYIEGENYNGESEQKTDLTSCERTVYICKNKEVNKENYDICRINKTREECTIDLERIRTEEPEGKERTVGQGQGPNGEDLKGLPPCGQKVWVYDKAIEYEERKSP